MNNGHNWKAMRTEHNGYVFIDPLVKEGDLAVLDGEYVTGGDIVTVHRFGKLFALVSVGSSVESKLWSTMVNRLNHVPEGYEPNPNRPTSALDRNYQPLTIDKDATLKTRRTK